MLSLDLVRSVLDSAPDAMVIVDASGAISYANRQVTALFGYEPEELSGRAIECLVPEQFRRSHVGHRQRFGAVPQTRRSEEHTSELQSQSNLVCRLLLEKKNKTQ